MKRSEEVAYREYVTARMDQLRRTAYLLCRDWHTADDLVSMALLKLYRHWGRAERMDGLDSYLRRILLNTWLDELRKPWRREQVVDEVPDVVATTVDTDSGDLLALLGELPPRRRAVLVLRFYCGLSVTQTAELLGCSEGTVKSQTSRGLDALRPLVSRLETT